jgi:hypothetical protein
MDEQEREAGSASLPWDPTELTSPEWTAEDDSRWDREDFDLGQRVVRVCPTQRRARRPRVLCGSATIH